MWGLEPWDNDRAADWFGRLVADSGFAEEVRAALSEALALDEWDDEGYVVRAACYCLLQFGHVYVWPVEQLEKDLRLGIAALERLKNEDFVADSAVIAADTDRMLRELTARLPQA